MKSRGMGRQKGTATILCFSVFRQFTSFSLLFHLILFHHILVKRLGALIKRIEKLLHPFPKYSFGDTTGSKDLRKFP